MLQRHESILAYDKRIIACGRNAKAKLNEHIAIAIHIIELIVIDASGARDGVALDIYGDDFSILKRLQAQGFDHTSMYIDTVYTFFLLRGQSSIT